MITTHAAEKTAILFIVQGKMLPIHIACVQGKAEIVTELIEKYGVDKSVVDEVYYKLLQKPFQIELTTVGRILPNPLCCKGRQT